MIADEKKARRIRVLIQKKGNQSPRAGKICGRGLLGGNTYEFYRAARETLALHLSSKGVGADERDKPVFRTWGGNKGPQCSQMGYVVSRPITKWKGKKGQPIRAKEGRD